MYDEQLDAICIFVFGVRGVVLNFMQF